MLVIGCPGSGKSTFSRRLAQKTGLELFHLDLLYWRADRTTVCREDFDARLDDVLSRESWIIDGDYPRTLERRLAACDTVFFLDYPAEICLAGIEERRGTPREDLPWTEVEGEADEELLDVVRSYAHARRPRVLALLSGQRGTCVYRFTERAEADSFLAAFGEEN